MAQAYMCIYDRFSDGVNGFQQHGSLRISPNSLSQPLRFLNTSEQNITHFRVKVDADREGDDDIWFELVNEDNSSKTYTNADFDQLLPIVSPIIQPNRIRIYMKPATSGATIGGTAITAVYWGTNDPQEI